MLSECGSFVLLAPGPNIRVFLKIYYGYITIVVVEPVISNPFIVYN